MASSSGSSRNSLSPLPKAHGRFRAGLPGGLVLGAIFFTASVAAAQPDYLRQALEHYSAEVPAGWAYTQTTVRDDESTTERFDPSRPPAGQWTLLRHNGRPPTVAELGKYVRFKAASAPPLAQAPFQKGDIDPGSLELVREDAERAEFSGAFRAQSAGADKMLGHLRLRLTVHKQPAFVEKFALDLRAPYSPVLGVKMNGLSVQMSFSPPAPDRPCLPAASTSLFDGRIFFVHTAEDLRITYSEFTRVAPSP